MLGRKDTAPPEIAAPPAPEPQHLVSEDAVFLAKLVADLADGKRRDEVASKDVLDKIEGVWKSGHERLAIEWMEKLLNIPEIPHASINVFRPAPGASLRFSSRRIAGTGEEAARRSHSHHPG